MIVPLFWPPCHCSKHQYIQEFLVNHTPVSTKIQVLESIYYLLPFLTHLNHVMHHLLDLTSCLRISSSGSDSSCIIATQLATNVWNRFVSFFIYWRTIMLSVKNRFLLTSKPCSSFSMLLTRTAIMAADNASLCIDIDKLEAV